MTEKYRIFLLILLCYITVFAFYPSLSAGFAALDDSVMIEQNPYIRVLSVLNIKNIFSTLYFKLYHPLVTLSYAAEYHLFGLDPWIYHADNILLHIINVILIFFIFKNLSKSEIVPYIVALLFAIHPTRVETVSWITSRKDTLCTLFYFSAFLCYVKTYSSKRYMFFMVLSFIFYIFSCLSKPMAVTFPAVMILTDFCFSEFSSKKIIKYIPFAVISLILCFVTITGYYSNEQINITTSYTRALDILNAHLNILYYIKIFFYPVYYFIHPLFFNYYRHIPDFVWYAPALLWSMFLFVVYSLKYTKKIFFGFMLFIIILMPSSGILQTGIAPVADRYVYAAFAGIFYIFAEFFVFLHSKSRKYRYILFLICALIFINMFYTTYNRAVMWKNNEQLIELAIKSFPESADHAYLMRGIRHINNNELELAQSDLDKSFKINPKTSYIHFNLGRLAQLKKDNDTALMHYKKLPKESTDYISAVNNVSIMFHDKKDIKKAIEIIEKNMDVIDTPADDLIYFTLATYYFELNNFDKVKEIMAKAVKINPGNKKIYMMLLNVYKKENDTENIKKVTAEALLNCPDSSDIFNFAGTFFFEKGDYDESEKMFWLSFKDNTKNDIAYFFLGNIYAVKQNYRQAVIFYTLAILQNRNNGEYNFKRAAAYYFYGKFELALKDMNEALKKGFNVPEEFKNNIKEKTDKGEQK